MKRNGSTKNLLALFIAIVIFVSALPMPALALGWDGVTLCKPINGTLEAAGTNFLITEAMVPADEPLPPVEITLSCQTDTAGFSVMRQKMTVSPGLAEEYGFSDSYGGIEPTALDAVVAAHVACHSLSGAMICDRLF